MLQQESIKDMRLMVVCCHHGNPFDHSERGSIRSAMYGNLASTRLSR